MNKIRLKLSNLMLKLTNPLLTRAESEAISVFRLSSAFRTTGVRLSMLVEIGNTFLENQDNRRYYHRDFASFEAHCAIRWKKSVAPGLSTESTQPLSSKI
jgi:hypothetical protein